MYGIYRADWDDSGSFVIVSPGIVHLEKCLEPGKLLRALEELEANEIERGHCGFEIWRDEINSIVDKEDHLGKDVHKLDVHAGTIETGRGPLFKIRAHTGEGETWQIDAPPFIKVRYQLDRTIRRRKTRIRTVGICLILIGFLLQTWPELARVFSLVG